MALTLSNVSYDVNGAHRENIWDITFDSSYATGGEALTPAQLGLVRVDHIVGNASGGYGVNFDRTNNKLLAYNGTTQVSNTTDLSAVTVRVRAYGI